jgi:hypothetical protein
MFLPKIVAIIVSFHVDNTVASSFLYDLCENAFSFVAFFDGGE